MDYSASPRRRGKKTPSERKIEKDREKTLRRAGRYVSTNLETLQNDKVFMLDLLSTNGDALWQVPNEFMADVDIVVAAIRGGMDRDAFMRATAGVEYLPTLMRSPTLTSAVLAKNDTDRVAALDDPSFAWKVSLERRALSQLRWGSMGSHWTDGSEVRRLRCRQKLPLKIQTLGGDDYSLKIWWQVPGGDLVALLKVSYPELDDSVHPFVLLVPKTGISPTVLELLVSDDPPAAVILYI